ncbi:uncharacterized protein LOC124445813 [Xenia sp. Carnegie-2017]|uniref:uncharacterized protein LOC124445813 n=1 Tax=Xenia sp. Carnegie-2017 TaxID=2897299 RepID=UPI001F040053|nr:uncharacterized protein LOC124445813 [Xenia sp. Carnegie-2017]
MYVCTYNMEANEMIDEVVSEDKLVELWPDYPCLYNVRSSEFKDRVMRQKALDEIAKAVNKNVEWVKNKLRTLRNCYTKAKKAPPSGTARRNLSKRTSWVLDKLQFFEEHVAIRATASNMDDTNSLVARDNSDNENGSMLQHAIDSDEDLNTLDLTDNNQQVIKSTKLPTKPRGKSLKRKLEEEELSVMRSLTSAIVNDSKKAQEDKEPGECESFGKFLVESLKKNGSTI